MEGAGRPTELLLQEARPERGHSETLARAGSHDSGGVLRLRAALPDPPRVHWSPGTVDNEDLNRKKSNVCCIFHKDDGACDREKGDAGGPEDRGGGGGEWNAYERQPRYDGR